MQHIERILDDLEFIEHATQQLPARCTCHIEATETLGLVQLGWNPACPVHGEDA